MLKKLIWMLSTIVALCGFANASAQTLRGTVTDATTSEELIGATVRLIGTDYGTVTDATGSYILTGMTPGRYDIEVRYLGYDHSIMKEVLVAGTKEVIIDVQMIESVSNELGEVVIRPHVNKMETLNPLSLLGGKMLSMEEASRYAGGYNDPARIVSSFAGIGGTSDNNGISVHGNSPQSLQWRLEGVEIFSPNHFAEVLESGAGVVGAISSQVMGNSDFYSTAYGAEYSNAFSGVFDMKLRSGNNTKYEHGVQLGTLGAELFSEGPLTKKSTASYIINYRYSITRMADKLGLVDMEGEIIDFQDINFKLNFPTKRAGTFGFFGVGMIDHSKIEEPTDIDEWETLMDADTPETNNSLGILGLKHSMRLRSEWQWQTTAVYNYYLIKADDRYYDFDFDNHKLNSPYAVPFSYFKQDGSQISLATSFSRQVTPKFFTKIGGSYTHNFYTMKYSESPYYFQPTQITSVLNENGDTGLANLYISNSWKPSNYWTLNFGLAGNYFLLCDELSIEPRLQLQFKPDDKNTITAGYGLNSRMEKLDAYFVGGKNKDLGLSKNQHLMLSYNHCFSDDINLRVETYYQYGFHIPVGADPKSTFSTVNRRDYFLTEPLVPKGNLRNYGIDATLEHYMKKGFYGMLNGSLYKMEYRTQDNVWRNVRYSREFLVKLLGGKEWMLGNHGKNVFNVSAKLTVMGGAHHTPVDVTATESQFAEGNIGDVIYKDQEAFSEQYDPMTIFDMSLSYKIVCQKVSHTIAFHSVNLFDTKSPNYDLYNFAQHRIDTWQNTAAFPNFYYRIDF